jgi:hypothetical protein
LKITLSKENKLGNFSEYLVNDALMGEALTNFQSQDDVYLIHDTSYRRKPDSRKLENLGKVRTLDNKIINGYSSDNVVAVIPRDKSVQLLSHELFSKKDPDFLKAEYVNKIRYGKNFCKKDESLWKKFL